MKVIGINGSPHREGNTAIIIREVFHVLEAHGIDTEFIQLGGSGIRPCLGCFQCCELKNGECIIKTDICNEILEKMKAAEGIILGSPVYTSDVTPEVAALIDRGALVSYGAGGGMLRHKVCASVTAVRRAGGMHAFDTMNHFFHITEGILVGAAYWNMFYGLAPGDVRKDEEGMANMRNLGENMAWLLERIHAKEQ